MSVMGHVRAVAALVSWRHHATGPRTLSMGIRLRTAAVNTDNETTVALGYTLSPHAVGGGSTGPPLVCLHGLFGSRANFRSQGKALGRALQRDVVLVDARNHGASEHSTVMSYTAMAADVQQLLASLGIDRAVVIGHSMGGKVAMNLALSHPELVERLVSVDVAPVAYATMSVICGVVNAMKAMPLDPDIINSREAADAWLSHGIPDVVMRQFILTNLITAKNANPPRWRVNLPAVARQMETIKGFDFPAGAVYSGKALFLYGSRGDYVVPARHGATIRALLPQSVTVPYDAAYWLHS